MGGWGLGAEKGPHPRCDDDRLEALEHGFDGQGSVHAAAGSRRGCRGPRWGPCGPFTPPHWGGVSPEVQDGVGNGGGPVIKGLDDDGETYEPGRFQVTSRSHAHPATPSSISDRDHQPFAPASDPGIQSPTYAPTCPLLPEPTPTQHHEQRAPKVYS